MIKKWIKKIIIIAILLIISIGKIVSAHSGRTDANGGHRDNKNVSGLGNYHYHCGGYPAHLHKNGVCPYSSDYTKEELNISVESVKIYDIEKLEVGETRNLIVTIEPSNSTDRSIIWKTSDEAIAVVDKNGKIYGKKPGIVYITAESSNGIKDKIKLVVEEKQITNITNNNIINSNFLNESKEKQSTEKKIDYLGIISIAVLGTLAGAWIYKKSK